MKLLANVVLCLVLLLLLSGVAAYWYLSPDQPPGSQAFVNAKVLTMNPANEIAEAVYLEGDRIVAVGTTEQIRRLSQPDTLVHDLEGRVIMPGLVDAHSHFPGSGVYEFAADLNAPPIGKIQNIEQMLSQLESHKLGNNGNEWLFGLGYDDTQMSDLRHPTRKDLDRVSDTQPIFILHVSGHMGVANSEALRRFGINATTVAPEGGEYVKDENGALSGLIMESAVTGPLSQATAYSLRDTLKLIKSAANEYASQGVTTVQNGAADMRYINGLKWASKFSFVPQRVIVWPVDGEMSHDELAAARTANTSKYSVGAVKIIADGSIQGYTGFLSKPYHVPPRDSDSSFRGEPVIPREALRKLVLDYFRVGSQLAIHGNGDASIDDILFAVEQAQQRYPKRDPRVVLVHAQMARADQLEKMKQLGITPSFFSAHTYYWGDRHRDVFMGVERAARMSPAKTAESVGLRYSIHLDTPVVPMQPMRLIWSATNRRSASGVLLGGGEKISVLSALRAMTIDAAYQIFKDDEIGSVEVGKFADLIVLDSDPLTVSVAQVDKLKVEQTFVGGVSIYQRSRRVNK